MVKIIKISEDNKFISYVDIREEKKDISFPEDLSKATLPEGYAKTKYEESLQEIGFSIVYDDVPTFTEDGWIIKFKEKIKEELPDDKISQVTMRQARLQLLELGLLDEVEAMVSQDRKNQIEWEYSNTVERDSNLINGIKVLLNLSDEQLDHMFMDAS